MNLPHLAQEVLLVLRARLDAKLFDQEDYVENRFGAFRSSADRVMAPALQPRSRRRFEPTDFQQNLSTKNQTIQSL